MQNFRNPSSYGYNTSKIAGRTVRMNHKRLVSASKTSSESATQVSPMTSYPHNTMKFKTTKTDHKAHHFVVDKSLTFATCSVCGVTMKRKTVGWDTREDVLT